VSNRKNFPHIGAWLEVDEENKKVEFRVDPIWLKDTNNEEQKVTLAKLTMLAAVYRRAGYAVFDFVKKVFVKKGQSS